MPISAFLTRRLSQAKDNNGINMIVKGRRGIYSPRIFYRYNFYWQNKIAIEELSNKNNPQSFRHYLNADLDQQ
jgi:hypothetical protein